MPKPKHPDPSKIDFDNLPLPDVQPPVVAEDLIDSTDDTD